MSEDTFLVKADGDLANKLRANFTSATCVEALMRAVVDMSTAVGVTVEWRVVSVDDDKIVDKAALTIALGRLACWSWR